MWWSDEVAEVDVYENDEAVEEEALVAVWWVCRYLDAMSCRCCGVKMGHRSERELDCFCLGVCLSVERRGSKRGEYRMGYCLMSLETRDEVM